MKNQNWPASLEVLKTQTFTDSVFLSSVVGRVFLVYAKCNFVSVLKLIKWTKRSEGFRSYPRKFKLVKKFGRL